MLQSSVFKGFPVLSVAFFVFRFSTVRNITRNRAFFGAMCRKLMRLELDRDHERE